MVLQIATISVDKPAFFELLEKAYHDIYMPAFPIDSERESLDKFFQVLQGEKPGMGIAINILGEHLEDPDRRVIKGISVAHYYEDQNVGLLAYNAIHPDHREKGLGKLMVQSRIESLKAMAAARGQKLEGIFIEVNNPAMVAAADDSMDPGKRLAIFEDWGARKIPIDYVQPPLSANSDYNDTMLLMNYPLDGEYCDKGCVEKYLRGIYEESCPEKTPDEDYFFKKMHKQLHDSDMPEHEKNLTLGYKDGVPRFKFVR